MRLRVLIVTKLYPNAVEPHSAPFNRQQFGALRELCDVHILAPVPWFPGARAFARWSPAGRLGEVPASEVIDGIPVGHPRFGFVPKVGHGFTAALYAACLLPDVLPYRGRVDVVLGSFAYPDGVAAVWLARLIGVPAVVKVHGSDLNVIGKRAGPRWNLARVLPSAERVVVVSRALADRAVEIGVARERIDVVGNGVDRSVFRVRDRALARRAVGQREDGRLLLYVGRLDRAKGVLDLGEAFARIAAAHPDLSLALVGDGPEANACRDLAHRFPGRLHLAGARPLPEVAEWMAACDALALPSWAEGVPNVILEALACGRRVVATAVGGIPEVINSPALGELVPARDVDALSAALARAARADYNPAAVASAARGDWSASAAALHDVLLRAVGRPAVRASGQDAQS